MLDQGSSVIPMSQTVSLTTDHQRVTMQFSSSPSDYVRLLFPLAHAVFSDFEALGVNVTVTIETRNCATATSCPWAVTEHSQHRGGGLEFGYKVPINFPSLA